MHNLTNTTYYQGDTCQWNISVSISGTISLTLISLDIPESGDGGGCEDGYLELSDVVGNT